MVAYVIIFHVFFTQLIEIMIDHDPWSVF